MAGTYYPTKDAEFIVWLQNFSTVATANIAALGLVAGDMTPITSLQPTYTTNLYDVESKKMALAAAVDLKDATKDTLIQKVRIVVNKIQANPTVTPTLKSQLGISTREGGNYPAHPVVPDQLVAELLADGGVELDWNRNGNAPGTQFVIEAKLAPSNTFTLVNVVTKTSFVFTNLLPGMRAEFIVRARRNNETSGPSNIAMVNAGGVTP